MPTLLSALTGLAACREEVVPGREHLEYAIVESASDITFRKLAEGDLDRLLSEYPQGVAFGELGELRWQRRTSGWHMVYLSDGGEALEGAMDWMEIGRIVTEDDGSELPKYVLLWGRREGDGAFREGRLPGELPYPFAGEEWNEQQLPALELRHYRGTAAGDRFSRLVRPKGLKLGELR